MRILLTITLLIHSINSNSQPEWLKSWCVTQTGDTIRGEILFRDWEISPTEITFRDSINSHTQNYGPTNLKAFGLDYNNQKEVFESKTIRVTKFGEVMAAAGTNTTTSKVETRFVELKFHSDVISLYILTDDNKMPHYYLMKDLAVTELIHGKAVIERSSKPFLIVNNDYKNQLKDLLRECPTLNVHNTDYSSKSLIKLLKEYHSFCKIQYDDLFENDDRVFTSVGISGTSFFPSAFEYKYAFNIGIRFLLPKKFNNRFVMAEVGRLTESEMPTQVAVIAGTYFGKGKGNIFPMAYAGVSNQLKFQLGTGISFAK